MLFLVNKYRKSRKEASMFDQILFTAAAVFFAIEAIRGKSFTHAAFCCITVALWIL